jgi:hypothetical protein
MKRFMFLSIGVLCLAIAVLMGSYVGSQRAVAQSAPTVVGLAEDAGNRDVWVVLSNGDIYRRVWAAYSSTDFYFPDNSPTDYVGNIWGNTISTDKSTWSGVKGSYNK